MRTSNSCNTDEGYMIYLIKYFPNIFIDFYKGSNLLLLTQKLSEWKVDSTVACSWSIPQDPTATFVLLWAFEEPLCDLGDLLKSRSVTLLGREGK